MTYDVSLLLDGLILVFLCVTIFYAARLSLFMKTFREGRSDMQRLIKDLSITIDKAESSVGVMKENAQITEAGLREIINEAKFLSEELKFMNETGDSLADRLEKLADRNRELVDLMESSGGIGTQKIMPYEPSAPAAQPAKKAAPKQSAESYDPFEISDFDLEAEDDDEHDFLALSDGAYRKEEADQFFKPIEEKHQSKVNTDAKSKVRSFAIFDRDHISEAEDDELMTDVATDDQPTDKQFHSRAEQDLYEALQRKKRAFDKELESVEGDEGLSSQSISKNV